MNSTESKLLRYGINQTTEPSYPGVDRAAAKAVDTALMVGFVCGAAFATLIVFAWLQI